MKYTQKQEKCKLTVTFKVTTEEWQVFDRRVYEQNKGKYSVPGFRKGHVPRNVLENRYGKVFFEDTLYACAQEYYGEFLDKNKEVIPVTRPSIADNSFKMDDKGVTFAIVLVVRPQVTLGQYKGLTVKKTTPQKVKDADVDAELQMVRQRNARMIEVTDRPVKDGDTVNIDYCGKIDGVAFEGGTAQKQNLTIGSHTFIPGFEEQVVGISVGETRDINVTFPEDYHAEELKGKPAVFTVTVNSITFKELPELDDEFAKDVSDFDNLADYKADIKKIIAQRYADDAARQDESNLVETVVNNTPVEIPDEMIEEEIDQYVEDFRYQLMNSGLDMDHYLSYSGKTLQDIRGDYRERAQKAIHTRLVFDEIVKAEKLSATDEDVNEEIKQYAEANHFTYEELSKQLQPTDRYYFENRVVTAMLLGLLKKQNTIA